VFKLERTSKKRRRKNQPTNLVARNGGNTELVLAGVREPRQQNDVSTDGNNDLYGK
jgi:hypothetical protein